MHAYLKSRINVQTTLIPLQHVFHKIHLLVDSYSYMILHKGDIEGLIKKHKIYK